MPFYTNFKFIQLYATLWRWMWFIWMGRICPLRHPLFWSLERYLSVHTKSCVLTKSELMPSYNSVIYSCILNTTYIWYNYLCEKIEMEEWYELFSLNRCQALAPVKPFRKQKETCKWIAEEKSTKFFCNKNMPRVRIMINGLRIKTNSTN